MWNVVLLTCTVLYGILWVLAFFRLYSPKSKLDNYLANPSYARNTNIILGLACVVGSFWSISAYNVRPDQSVFWLCISLWLNWVVGTVAIVLQIMQRNLYDLHVFIEEYDEIFAGYNQFVNESVSFAFDSLAIANEYEKDFAIAKEVILSWQKYHFGVSDVCPTDSGFCPENVSPQDYNAFKESTV